MEKMDAEELRVKKQEYLREHIMDKGYDTEHFVRMMEARKSDGSDIDNWSLAELHDIVSEYHRSGPKKLDRPDGHGTGRKTSNAEHEENAQKKRNSLLDAGTQLSIYKGPMPDEVKTQGKDENELTNVSVRAMITGSRVVDAGMFKSKFVLYKIDTSSKGWSVERKYKDFCDLALELSRLHPWHIVPPIYGNASESETESKVIASRKQMLQQFLDDLLAHPLLKCDELVYHFLHYHDQGGKKADEFIKRLKLYSLVAPPKDVDEQKTPQGRARVALSDELLKFMNSLDGSASQLQPLFKELQNLGKQMNLNIDKLAETMTKQQGVCKEIAGHYKILGEPTIASSFESLSLIYSKLNTSYLQIQKMIMEVFKPLNKQFLFEYSILNERLGEVKSFKIKLSQMEKKLKDRKTALFDQQDLTKWELPADCSESMESLFNNRVVAFREMLPRETKECTKMRMLYGFVINKTREEFQRLCAKNQDLLAVSLLFVSKINADTVKDVFRMWTELADRYLSYKSRK